MTKRLAPVRSGIENPYPKAPFPREVIRSDGAVTYDWDDPEHPGYSRFQALTPRQKQNELQRLGMGLAPVARRPLALSKKYPNRKSGILALARYIRDGDESNGGPGGARILRDFWNSVVTGQHPLLQNMTAKDQFDCRNESAKAMAQYGFARFAPVDDKGEALPEDRRTLIINVTGPEAKAITERIVEGERTA